MNPPPASSIRSGSATPPVARRLAVAALGLALIGTSIAQPRPPVSLASDEAAQVDLSPTTWRSAYDEYLARQQFDRDHAGSARGSHGAVTVAYNALAGRAGLEALHRGGNAMDAALVAALTQVALTGGAPVSYFGIVSLIYYDAATGTIHTLDGGWNSVLGEDDPLSIPGGVGFGSDDALRGIGEPSGRTALVGGFLRAVEAAHQRFGSVPFAELFAPAIHVAEEGIPVSEKFAGYLDFRAEDLKRLDETRRVFARPDGSGDLLRAGDTFRQPALAETLRAVARGGADHLYDGPWSERAVAAIQRDGGKMTLEDLRRYTAVWGEPLRATIGPFEIAVPAAGDGGVNLIEAQLLARASGMLDDGHWTRSGVALRKAHDVTQAAFLGFLPEATRANLFPGVDFSPTGRLRPANAERLWKALEAGRRPFRFAVPEALDEALSEPRHSDDVVAVDRQGNMVALTHTINCVLWGRTAIVVDGITIGDPASFQQRQLALIEPGERLPGPTEEGIVLRDGQPVLAFASMGSGLHQRTFQGLLNVLHYGMSVRQAIDTADFFMPETDPRSFRLRMTVPTGRFPRQVLEQSGYAWREHDPAQARFAGEGIWVAISRDPATGELEAASHNRNNSAAVAW